MDGPHASLAIRLGARVAHAGIHSQAQQLTIDVHRAGAGEDRLKALEPADLPEDRDERRQAEAEDH
ncbi:hypothetical protein [Methylobacterium sp. yr668]|uniref:hypothetical protein n=1 Tax=Methylobacterium sp. yr668 TaxID=1761801 RepID=UPI0015874ACB|nr:hypothetical protein [Methylobacterium sp. yr668]